MDGGKKEQDCQQYNAALRRHEQQHLLQDERSFEMIIVGEKEVMNEMPKKKMSKQIENLKKKPDPTKGNSNGGEQSSKSENMDITQHGVDTESSLGKGTSIKTHKQIQKEKNADQMHIRRQDEEIRRKEQVKDSEARKRAREDEEKRQRDQQKNLQSMAKLRSDEERRALEQVKDSEKRKRAREDEEKNERDRQKSLEAKRKYRKKQNVLRELQLPQEKNTLTQRDTLKRQQLNREHNQMQLDEENLMEEDNNIQLSPPNPHPVGAADDNVVASMLQARQDGNVPGSQDNLAQVVYIQPTGDGTFESPNLNNELPSPVTASPDATVPIQVPTGWEEQIRNTELRRLARLDREKQQRDRERNLASLRAGRAVRAELDQMDEQPASQELDDALEEVTEQLKNLRRDHFHRMCNNNFDTDLFLQNPLLKAGRALHCELESTHWNTCINCNETYICMELAPRAQRCKRCMRNKNLFAPENDLTPLLAPPCLSDLTPIEKSCISLICPIIGIYKKGHSTASKGHTISVIQDVNQLATTLPRLPANLPFIIIKGPNEHITDQTFRVRRQSLINALLYLKANNEDYRHINISHERALLYPVDDIFEDLPQIDPAAMQIPEDEITAVNPESAVQDASMLTLPRGAETIMENINKHFDIEWPKRENKPASEFMMGFFSKAFPDLFPDGKGDITKPRIGKNPPFREYFKHLMRVNRAFVEHHCFTFFATNFDRRHEALTRGNVFAKHCAAQLTMAQLKEAVRTNNFRVINKLLYFAAPIPGTRQYLRYKTDQAVSFVRYLRIESNDTQMFNFFQTFSAADLHWDDLHRLLPGSDRYLNKCVVDNLEQVPEEERNNCITKTHDARLRIANVTRHADVVDWYFTNRTSLLLKKVLPNLGAKHYICRYEVQARGTIHAHILLHIQDGPSHSDMERAFKNAEALPNEARGEVLESQQKMASFAAHHLGISGMHPNPKPPEWPGPYGQDVYTPLSNCLRERYLTMAEKDQYKCQYEKLINRCMLHHCREGYCKSKARRDKTTGAMICRFHFPIDMHGFKPTFEAGKIISLEKIPTATDVGANFDNGTLKFLRNHPTIVHHIPELLLLWGANIEGRPVQSYKQVLRYLLKYMFKDEPNSSPFQAITKSVVEAIGEEEPTRRLFQKILMKTVGEHDLSKQECHHILNGLDFVTFSEQFVMVNVSGTTKVRMPEVEGDEQRATEDNWASLYWNRETDSNYVEAVGRFTSGQTNFDPRDLSLYQFASRCNKKWKLQPEKKVPHITPNFNIIPKKVAEKDSRYGMFLRATLLTHVPGFKLQDVIDKSIATLEQMMNDFVSCEDCPNLVKEDYRESQESIINPEEEEEETVDPPRPNEDDLHIEPEPTEETYEQNEWMEQLKTLHHVEENFYEDDNDYDDLELLVQSRTHDWQEDRRRLNLTDADLDTMATWINEQKQTYNMADAQNQEEAATYEDLNEKQKIAFDLIRRHIERVQEVGPDAAPQLLLNISGGAGTGKTFWLNAVRQLAANTIGSQFVLTAAPSGTAAFLIGGETLHGMLYLPLGNSKLDPLIGERLFELQKKFQHVGILFIDEKSMMGQQMFWMVGERLKQARPKHQDKPFGNLSVVLLGDWKQLPPVGDRSLFDKDSTRPAGYNLYQLFNDAIIFDVVQRQTGNDQEQFRRDLQSLGDGEFSLEMWKRWRSRALDFLPEEEQVDFFQNGILACALKKDMVKHNIQKVKANGQPIAPIAADSTPAEARRESSERSSGLISKIIISRNTTFRLTANLWTKAGLTNGSVGKIQGIIYKEGQQPPSLPTSIIATFKDYKGPAFIADMPKSVPIVPYRREWFSNKIHCSRTMLPIILGYALSIHKLQGATCERVILNPGKKEFASGLMLVGATRTKKFENLAFSPFPNYSRFQQVHKKFEKNLN